MQLWLFGFTSEETETVDRLLHLGGWPAARMIRPEQAGARVEQILRGTAESASPLVTEEKLALFQEATDEELGQFLDAYGRQVLPQPLWAVVTEVSRKWIFSQLLQELQREREELARQADSFPEGE